MVGASGGLGASTLALAVGRRLAATGPPAVVVDLDLGGGGLEVTAGVEHLPGRRWDDLRHVRGRVPPDLLVQSLPGEAGCSVLSARGGAALPLPHQAVLDVLDSLLDGRCTVVLDLPPTSPVLEGAIARAGLVLVALGLRARALADADACVDRLLGATEQPGGREAASAPPLHLVTRGGRARPDLLDDVMAHLGVPHLHHLVDDVRVPRDAERGVFPGVSRDAVRECADAVVRALDDRAEAS